MPGTAFEGMSDQGELLRLKTVWQNESLLTGQARPGLEDKASYAMEITGHCKCQFQEFDYPYNYHSTNAPVGISCLTNDQCNL